MTTLIKSQLLTAAVMLCGGMTAGLINDVFSLFARRFIKTTNARGRRARNVVKLAGYGVIGMVLADFAMYCQNGKVTLLGAVFLLAGIRLWRKYFYDILNSTDDKV